MNPNDLLKMLGLESKPKEPEVPYRGLREQQYLERPESITESYSSTALVLDKWDLARGREQLNSTLVNKGVTQEAMADFYGASFNSEPILAPNCVDQRRHSFVKMLLESPEYQALHTTTRLNQAQAALASHKIAEAWVKLMEQDSRRDENLLRRKRIDPQVKTQGDLIRAVGSALREATEATDELEEMQYALGCGPGSVEASKLNNQEIATLFRRTRNHALLRRILELAGRYRRVAQSRQRNKVIHGYDDMVGITVDDDISKVLSSEIARLDDPDLELETLLRIVSKQAMAREYRGIEPQGKGPIVVCVDESGSMHGEPVCNAKAFALAMAWVARHQKRWCVLCSYSGSRNNGVKLVLPHNKWDQTALCEWLESYLGGGTTMDVPMDVLPNQWWNEFLSQGMPRGKVDLIFVTDGVVSVPNYVGKAFMEWKAREKVRLISLILNCPPGPLALYSDELYRIATVNLGETGVLNAMSI